MRVNAEYHRRFLAGEVSRPHVAEWSTLNSTTYYTGRTMTWEGPARPDYPAAAADLSDHLSRKAA